VIQIVLLAGRAAVIYLSCEWFVNPVEWLGQRLRLGPLAAGTILAAFGTALPESVVTLVAVAFGTNASHKEIGVGAAMGGPLALATVAYGVTGWMLLARRCRATAPAHGGESGVDGSARGAAKRRHPGCREAARGHGRLPGPSSRPALGLPGPPLGRPQQQPPHGRHLQHRKRPLQGVAGRGGGAVCRDQDVDETSANVPALAC
jgi:hypothetical protein